MNPMDPTPRQIPILPILGDTLRYQGEFPSQMEIRYHIESPKDILFRMITGGQFHAAMSINDELVTQAPESVIDRVKWELSRHIAGQAHKKMNLESYKDSDYLTTTFKADLYMFSAAEIRQVLNQVRQLKTEQEVVELMVRVEEMRNGR